MSAPNRSLREGTDPEAVAAAVSWWLARTTATVRDALIIDQTGGGAREPEEPGTRVLRHLAAAIEPSAIAPGLHPDYESTGTRDAA